MLQRARSRRSWSVPILFGTDQQTIEPTTDLRSTRKRADVATAAAFGCLSNFALFNDGMT